MLKFSPSYKVGVSLPMLFSDVTVLNSVALLLTGHLVYVLLSVVHIYFSWTVDTLKAVCQNCCCSGPLTFWNMCYKNYWHKFFVK